jgi:starvation-inducible DNA-binding protein
MNEHNNTGAGSANAASSALSIAFEGGQKEGEALRFLLADFFTLYFKTKNFHWHTSGAHFRGFRFRTKSMQRS